MIKTSALRSTTTATATAAATAEDDAHAPSRRTRRNEEGKDKDKERQPFSNLFRASTTKIGSELDLALETGQVDVSLERSVREERFAHVRLVGGWSWGSAATRGGLGGGEGVGGGMGFKYDPRALREAVFGGAAGGVKRRKVAESAEGGGDHKKDKDWEEEAKREDVVLFAGNATNERVVFVYRGFQPLRMMPTNVDKNKEWISANPTQAIGSKRPREEEQDDEEYGAVYDVFRERRVTGSAPPTATVAPAPTTTGTDTATTSDNTITITSAKGVRFAAGSKLADGGCRPQRRRRHPGMGSASNGKAVWRRTVVMRNVCESDVEFGKDGVCLWVRVTPPAAAKSTPTTATVPITTSIAATAAPPAFAFAGGGGGWEKEPRLTRLEAEDDGIAPVPVPVPTTTSCKTKDERRGVFVPCKVWRWRPPPRVTARTRAQVVEKEKEKMEVEEKKMEVEV